jgi:hypothetical protein
MIRLARSIELGLRGGRLGRIRIRDEDHRQKPQRAQAEGSVQDLSLTPPKSEGAFLYPYMMSHAWRLEVAPVV